jgi:hypothetical protein
MLVVIGMAYLLGVLQVPLSPLTVGAATAVMAGPSSSSFRGVEPLAKKAHHWPFLMVSSWYACDVVYWFTLFPLLLSMF